MSARTPNRRPWVASRSRISWLRSDNSDWIEESYAAPAARIG